MAHTSLSVYRTPSAGAEAVLRVAIMKESAVHFRTLPKRDFGNYVELWGVAKMDRGILARSILAIMNFWRSILRFLSVFVSRLVSRK